MIHIISDAIAKWLEMEGTVSTEDRTLYAYAAYSFLFGTLPIGIVMLLGSCFGMLQEGIVIIIPFMMLRKFCGGFHLKSSGICFFATIGVLTFSLGLVTCIIHAEQMGVLTVLVCLSVLSLCIFSPIENQARKLSEKERIVFRTAARILSLISFMIYVFLSFYTSTRYSTAFGVGILLVGALQGPCVLRKALSPRLKSETKCG